MKKRTPPKQNPEKNSARKRVLLLHTGGTIGMALPVPHAPSKAFAKTLRSRVPELWDLADVSIHIIANKDSSQITPSDWKEVAAAIEKFSDDYDAFVVTHGTDTMVYTGTALSYALPFPCKPVVMTGSQRPLGEIRTDARRNLINSVAFAAQQWICEVTIFFDTVLLRANRAKKMHIEEFGAFGSPNFPILAEERLKTRIAKPGRERLARPLLRTEFDPRVQVVKVFPGSKPVLHSKAKAVVIEAFGCGNLPMLGFLKTCARKRIPVVLTSQVHAGALSPELYALGRRALELGAIPSRDMTFEATLVKCMMLVANEVKYEDWLPAILTNWAGEISGPTL